MKAMLKKYASIFAPLLMVSVMTLASAGCAEKNGSGQDSAGGEDATGLSPNSPNLTYAKDWTELDLDANSAKTKIDPAGHFHTDKNMCQQPGDGVYDVTTWNIVAGLLNQAVNAAVLPKERCWDSPNGSKFYNKGVAELVISKAGATPSAAPVVSKRTLYEYKNAQICTMIADATLADTLIEQIETTLKAADRADAMSCPNYRPQ